MWVRANDGTQWSAWSQAFTVTAQVAAVNIPPVVTPVSTSITASRGRTWLHPRCSPSATRMATPSPQYDFWDTGGGGGHFLVNGVAQPINTDIIVSASQLAQTTYQPGTAADTLWVRANDGTQWSAWSSSFTAIGTADSALLGASSLGAQTTLLALSS